MLARRACPSTLSLQEFFTETCSSLPPLSTLSPFCSRHFGLIGSLCVDNLTKQPSNDKSVDGLSYPQSRNDGLAFMLTRDKLGILLEVCQDQVGHDVEANEQEHTDLEREEIKCVHILFLSFSK